jgi:hypothetical protein
VIFLAVFHLLCGAVTFFAGAGCAWNGVEICLLGDSAGWVFIGQGLGFMVAGALNAYCGRLYLQDARGEAK